ncbi:MAG: hypothetical protein ACLQVD_07115 [Capsulimonadaceae bacterium]
MELLFAGLFTVGVAVVGVWLSLYSRSLRADRIAAERETEERRRLDETEARLRKAGEPLLCLSCGAEFVGPLPEDGCPACHLSGMVVPARALSDS